MKKLPLGIQNFREIIEGDYVYIDKTQYVYNLINDASYYFLSRPRRFGKSLLLDTISEVFSGDKELFKGLWIYDSDYDFKKHPVIRLDMSNISNKTPEILENSLVSTLRIRVKEEGLYIADEIPSDIFKNLISGLYKKYNQRVVVLIDEYDKPILDHINDIKTAEANRLVLRGFYGILKSMDPYLKFTFLTGVTKFTKTSIFSELNNLLDITMAGKYANICGITIEDFDRCFSEHIEHLTSLKEFKIYNSVRNGILAWYDGYSWDGETRVINPFSLLSFFRRERFAAFWYVSGTPKFLIDLIKKKPETYTNLKNLKMTEFMLDSADLEKISIEPLLFQTGYLTVKEIPLIADEPIYILDMPNNEVRRAFNLHIISSLTESDDVRAGQARIEIG
ncbi:MAG: AAA family ATPase, partial [Oscillospiraceae bacterium]|nr:AAA family ATPase [Oscillospiraceae bacterium]